MKKYVCPSCGKVNYEAFTTFPHCAECGALLPGIDNASPARFWQKPVGALWWVSLLGIAAIGVAFFATILTNERVGTDQLLAYGTMQRNSYVGSETMMKLTLDTVSEGGVLQNRSLKDVEVRFPRAVFHDWVIVSVAPPPKEVYSRGSGTYYRMGDLPIHGNIYLAWKARKAGEYRFAINVFASNLSPVRIVATTQVHASRDKE